MGTAPSPDERIQQLAFTKSDKLKKQNSQPASQPAMNRTTVRRAEDGQQSLLTLV